MYRIEILDNCNDDKFNQLKDLIKKFAIDVFVYSFALLRAVSDAPFAS